MRKLLSIFIISVSVPAFAQTPTDSNLIINGFFEEGNAYFTSDLEYKALSVSPGEYSVVDDATEVNRFFKVIPDSGKSRGKYLVVDAGTDPENNFWCSSLMVTPNSTYQFSLSAANIYYYRENPPELVLQINGSPVGNPQVVSDSLWGQYNWVWKSGRQPDSAEICLKNINTHTTGSDIAVDNIRLVKVESSCPYLGDTISGLVHFGFNEAILTEYSRNRLDQLFERIRECPDHRIKILGHTDPYGSDSYNMSLSEKRTIAVRDYLISEGIQPEKLIIDFMGENQVIEPGESISDNIINRRVEFVFVE